LLHPKSDRPIDASNTLSRGLQPSQIALYHSRWDSTELKMASQPEVQPAKKRIILNAFDMFTVGHISFGQWRNPKDKAATKRRDLTYWTNLAKLLEEGDINALFLADTYGVYDVYKGSAATAFRTATQYPVGDPLIVSSLAWSILVLY
jgi:hypothetical protein